MKLATKWLLGSIKNGGVKASSFTDKLYRPSYHQTPLSNRSLVYPTPTYKGKNTAEQVQQDAVNLCGAECRDTNALRVNMVAQGYDPKLVDEAISKILERNRQTGVIK